KTGIIGGAGYTGGELIRLLVNHPFADISFVHSKSNAGKKLSSVHQDIILDTEQEFTGQLNFEVDVLFLCVGHGNSINFLQENKVPSRVKIISLSQDFRLKENSVFED